MVTPRILHVPNFQEIVLALSEVDPLCLSRAVESQIASIGSIGAQGQQITFLCWVHRDIAEVKAARVIT